MADEGRVEPGPAVRRGAPVAFRFDGRRIAAFEGETVGAALWACGERVLMRSIKYHRPRGLFCNTGACASCLVRVDGKPNQRACLTPVREGMRVETQNAFPSARRDLLAVVDKVYRSSFDPHETFTRPGWIRPFFHYVVRRMAGFGKRPTSRPLPPRRPPVARRDVDVLVVGSGPAGLAAAVAAAEGAASVLLVEESDRLGGSLLLRRDVRGEAGAAVADALAARLVEADGEALPDTVAVGVYRTDLHGEEIPPPGLVALMTPHRLLEVRAKALVVATGYHETPMLFPGNDLPGVMGSRAALLLLHRHGVLAGRRVLAATDSPIARRAALDLAAAGARLVGIVGDGDLAGARVTAAEGGARLERVRLHRDGRTWHEEADLLLTAGDETPRVELVQQAGARLAWNGRAYAAHVDGHATSVPGVFAVGEVLGVSEDVEALLRAGAAAGEAAAKRARGVVP